jgi:hypothetical protein
MNPLEYHFENEMRLAGLLSGNDPLQDAIVADLRKMLKQFLDTRVATHSSKVVAELFERLVEFKPLSPLQGTEDEWIKIPDVPTEIWQNRRCFTVFRTPARVYDIDAGPLYKLPDGTLCVSGENALGDAIDVTFPYMPGSVSGRPVIDVDARGNIIQKS